MREAKAKKNNIGCMRFGAKRREQTDNRGPRTKATYAVCDTSREIKAIFVLRNYTRQNESHLVDDRIVPI